MWQLVIRVHKAFGWGLIDGAYLRAGRIGYVTAWRRLGLSTFLRSHHHDRSYLAAGQDPAARRKNARQPCDQCFYAGPLIVIAPRIEGLILSFAFVE